MRGHSAARRRHGRAPATLGSAGSIENPAACPMRVSAAASAGPRACSAAIGQSNP